MKKERIFRPREIRCDESMAKHKPIKFLYHLQKEKRPYRSYEVLYGNCNHDCKNCICAMYDVDMSNRLVGEHMPANVLEKGSAQQSMVLVRLKYGK